MIIPPDPEKDPNIFSATSSTPSLFESTESHASEDGVDGGEDRDSRARRSNTTNTAFGYPYILSDDLGVGYGGEALPPYRRASVESGSSNVFADPRTPVGGIHVSPSPPPPAVPPMRERNQRTITVPSITIPAPARATRASTGTDDEVTPTATSNAGLPFTAEPSSLTAASSSKSWEGSRTDQKRWRSLPTMTPGWKRRWKKYRKWIYICIALLLAGMGVMVGLLVGLKAGSDESALAMGVPWKDLSGDKRQTWVSTGESLNVTYNPQRDGPYASDGNITNCPSLRPINASAPSLLLSRPFPAARVSVAQFEYPLWKNGTALQMLPEFTFIARGLGSSGTVEIVGTDAPPEVLADGKEGVMRVEVIATYSGQQDLEDIVRVCQLSRGNKGIGLGVFTPQETDGRVNTAYMLNPASLPSFHIIVHLPPSSVTAPTRPTVGIPSLGFDLDRMAVRFGNLENVVQFGNINVTSTRGGVDAIYVGAERVDIRTGENVVRGRWNITESLIVNNTDGAIVAEVIVHDKNSTDKNLALDSPFSRRWQSYNMHNIDGNSSDAYEIEKTSATDINGNVTYTSDDDDDSLTTDLENVEPAPKRVVNTWFMTTAGVLAVAYIYQAPTVSLSGLFQNGQGDTSVSIHPNYIGPFVVKDIWGQVRVPPPAPINAMDPLAEWRSRSVTFGQVDIRENGIYTDNGLNSTVLENSAVALSGAAYWRGDTVGNRANGTMMAATGMLTPQEVQKLEESDDQILVLGAWGNVQVTFDGR